MMPGERTPALWESADALHIGQRVTVGRDDPDPGVITDINPVLGVLVRFDGWRIPLWLGPTVTITAADGTGPL